MIGVIGGSGLYQMEGLTNVREERIETPFGAPSDAYILGDLDGTPMAFSPGGASSGFRPRPWRPPRSLSAGPRPRSS